MNSFCSKHPNLDSDDIEATAAEWMARRNGGPLSADEAAQLEAWLSLDPRHGRALEAMETVWRTLNEPRRQGHGVILDVELTRRSRQRRGRWRAYSVAGLAAAAALAFMVRGAPDAMDTRRGDSSMVARPDSHALPDGSSIELNLGAEYVLEFTAESRVVRLVRGEALFVVKSDPARPFVVRAGEVEVRAVGTAFSVRRDPQQINVLVTHGQVAVGRVAARVEAPVPHEGRIPRPVLLEMGRQVVVSLDLPAIVPLEVRRISADELKAALAWRNKRIEFTDTPLAEAVKLFNRENAVELVLEDAALGRRIVTGIFWADDPEGFVRLLETGFGARAERTGDVIRIRSE